METHSAGKDKADNTPESLQNQFYGFTQRVEIREDTTTMEPTTTPEPSFADINMIMNLDQKFGNKFLDIKVVVYREQVVAINKKRCHPLELECVSNISEEKE